MILLDGNIGDHRRVARATLIQEEPSDHSIGFRKERAMQTKTLILAHIALFTLCSGPAISGPCTAEIDAIAKTLAAKDAGSGPTAGGAPTKESPAGLVTQHPPTSIMKQQTEGRATSPEDVRRQTTGQPTAGQQGTSAAGSADSSMKASSALDRARVLDRQGKEGECMEAVREARQFAGQR